MLRINTANIEFIDPYKERISHPEDTSHAGFEAQNSPIQALNTESLEKTPIAEANSKRCRGHWALRKAKAS